MRPARLAPIASLALAIALTCAACGPKTIHTAAVLSDQFAQGLVTAQATVRAVYDGGAMTPATYQLIQRKFESLARIGLVLNQALRDGHGQAALAQVSAALTVVDAMIAEDIPRLSEQQRVTVMVAIVSLKSVLLAYASTLGSAPCL